MISIESTGKTVQIAIEEGLAKLNKSIDEVDINIISSGGFLKKARVEISVIEDKPAKPAKAEKAEKTESEKIEKVEKLEKAEKVERVEKTEKTENVERKAEQPKTEQPKPAQTQPNTQPNQPKREEKPAPAQNSAPAQEKKNFTQREKPNGEKPQTEKPATEKPQTERAERQDRPKKPENREGKEGAQRPERKDRPERKPFEKKPAQERLSSELGEDGAGAKEDNRERRERPKTPITDEVIVETTQFITDLLNKMDVEYQLESSVTDGELTICIKCENGAIIGYRGETLDAIEYLTSLAINRSDDKYYRINIDCNDYRSKRIETLTNLARRMAEKAVKTGRKVVLDPMSSSSRKVIHSVLAENDRIITKSEGKDPTRRIIIIPKRYNNSNKQ